MTSGRGKPTKAISQRTAPREKNQNSSPAQSRCVTVARAKTVKKVWPRIVQAGSKKIATTNFTQRVGTVTGSDAGTNRVVRATLRTIFRPWSGLRFARLVVDLRFVAAKVVPRLRRRRGERKSNPSTQTRERQFEAVATALMGRAHAAQRRGYIMPGPCRHRCECRSRWLRPL